MKSAKELLELATELETQNPTRALEVYHEIVEKFYESPESTIAKQRMDIVATLIEPPSKGSTGKYGLFKLNNRASVGTTIINHIVLPGVGILIAWALARFWPPLLIVYLVLLIIYIVVACLPLRGEKKQ